MKIYFDNAATTQIYPEVIDEMTSVLKNNYGNPSSIHSFGRESKVLIEDARSRIATHLNVLPSEIFFTSGGTEAITTAINGCIQEKEIGHIISSPIEHHAVLHTIKALEHAGLVKVTMVDVDDKGNVDLEDLHEVLKTNVKSLVVLMHANNEIGSLLPMKKVGELCSDFNAIFFSDTVQTIGKYKNDLKNINLHFATCSGHKFHGPKGVGFLYINDDVRISPLFKGGGQERNMRSGTENIAGIVGLAKAFDIAYSNMEQTEKYIEGLKTYMADELQKNFSEIRFNADSHKQGLFTVLNVSFPRNEKTEMLLFNLDIAGIATSGGSACASGVVTISHVLKEIRCDESRVPIRFSFGKFNTKEEVDYCVGELKRLL
ncbi:MAG: cysteine desulfurase [Saprospiraceae bacterium]|nr:cysteine desulfurase [Saprospiraceae bacterium]